MKLVIIFGPQAVGKMTVGHELEKITGLKLFHNHMAIELVVNFFPYDPNIDTTNVGTAKRLITFIREEILKEISSSDMKGVIFTYVWNFDREGDWDFIERISKIFRDKRAGVYYVELEADVDERIRRNKTEHRLKHKPSKRDLAFSEKLFRDEMINDRVNSKKGEIKEKNYLRIDNTHLDAMSVAVEIKKKFNL